MQIGKVVGTATSTIKHPSFEGERLVVVQLETSVGGDDGEPVLAFDRLVRAGGIAWSLRTTAESCKR